MGHPFLCVTKVCVPMDFQGPEEDGIRSHSDIKVHLEAPVG